jgi:hypothetical protein
VFRQAVFGRRLSSWSARFGLADRNHISAVVTRTTSFVVNFPSPVLMHVYFATQPGRLSNWVWTHWEKPGCKAAPARLKANGGGRNGWGNWDDSGLFWDGNFMQKPR